MDVAMKKSMPQDKDDPTGEAYGENGVVTEGICLKECCPNALPWRTQKSIYFSEGLV